MALKTLSPQEAKDSIIKQGKTVRQVAAEIGCNYGTVIAVLSGRNRGKFGEAHKVAVALGLKEAA